MWTLFFLTYLAGFLTIVSPCIFPILPFLAVRSGIPWHKGGLPLLLGLALTFAAVSSLAAVAGSWAIEANRIGRTIALATMAVSGLGMMLPRLAATIAWPVVALGARMTAKTSNEGRTASSLLVGIATGLLWAPCAGPVLGLILTGAALRGPSLETSLLLLAYGSGAATALAAGMMVGKRVFALIQRSVGWTNHVRRIAGGAVVLSATSIWFGLDTRLLQNWSSRTTTTLEQTLLSTLPDSSNFVTPAKTPYNQSLSEPLTSLLTGRQWLNAAPLTAADLAGKVVLINFWTYSCINCLRVLPHVRDWAQTYGQQGLVVVGVHTPEFAFEKDAANVRKALQALGISYPVTTDNDFDIWRAFGNRAWPGLYLFGPDGRLARRVQGEGEYGQTERVIQQLLAQAGAASVTPASDQILGSGSQAEPDLANLRSAETYIGYASSTGFTSPEGIKRDMSATYQAGSNAQIDRWSLTGTWTIGAEFATVDTAGSRIIHRFHARDLHIVLAPGVDGREVRFRVTLDGAPPGANHGADIDAEGWGTVRDGRLYQLIRQSGAIGDRTIEIEFTGSGVRAYAFTFG